MLCDNQSICKKCQDTRYCYKKCKNYFYEKDNNAADNFKPYRCSDCDLLIDKGKTFECTIGNNCSWNELACKHFVGM